MENMNETAIINPFSDLVDTVSEKKVKLVGHKLWLSSIQKERPLATKSYNIGVYIRFFNQTKHENYLDNHKKQFEKVIKGCPNWNLVGFYVDEGQTPPLMENAKAWCRLIDDCEEGKVDLIVTQKISNVAKDPLEVTLCSRLLAAHNPPIGIYFISEDIFTLASYYQSDLKDPDFMPLKCPNLDNSERFLDD